MRYISAMDLGRYSEIECTTEREYSVTNEIIEFGASIGNDLTFSEAKEMADQYLLEIGIDFMDTSYICKGRCLNLE